MTGLLFLTLGQILLFILNKVCVVIDQRRPMKTGKLQNKKITSTLHHIMFHNKHNDPLLP